MGSSRPPLRQDEVLGLQEQPDTTSAASQIDSGVLYRSGETLQVWPGQSGTAGGLAPLRSAPPAVRGRSLTLALTGLVPRRRATPPTRPAWCCSTCLAAWVA